MTHPTDRRDFLRGAVATVGMGTAAALASCSPDPSPSPRGSGASGPSATSSVRSIHEVAVRTDGAGTVLPEPTPGSDGALGTAASAALLASASVVVVAAGAPHVDAAYAAASHLGIPLLEGGPTLIGELDRLGAETVILYPDKGADVGARTVVPGGPVTTLPALPGLPRTPAGGGALVLLAAGATLPRPIRATVKAAGATVLTTTQPDPRRSEPARKALRDNPGQPVLAVGAGFGTTERFAARVRTAARARDLPGGGLMPFPDRMMIALYGHPEAASLGTLGIGNAASGVRRATALAKQYAALTRTPVVPAFELIATVASAAAGKDGSYSRKTAIDVLLPWIEAAEKADIYCVLDLQPGRTDFLTQAKEYEELLRRPWVGLALDPEWRLGPKEVHLKQIGHVDVSEVNEVAAWLAALVREGDLPPKVFTLHQFQLQMIRHRERLDLGHDELQVLVHVDGSGGQGAKQDTWDVMRAGLPKSVFLGWKNFEDEDFPMLTVAQTMARVQPTPNFVSYQ